jgi:hypothetical protein
MSGTNYLTKITRKRECDKSPSRGQKRLKNKMKAIRNFDADYIDENSNKRFYVSLETDDDVIDYISFDTENDAFTFIEYYNHKS